jgi:type IV pilus assembly protein PilW
VSAGNARRAPPRQQGFGLVEMMVALALGLLVVGGAVVLFIATRQANGTTDNLGRVGESVRTSYDLMTREVREAGGTPCDAHLMAANVLNNAQGGTPTWWATWGEPLHGYGGAAAFDGADFGSAVGQRVAGTAALLVRYAGAIDGLTVAAHDPVATRFTTSVNNHGIGSGELLLVCNYRQGAILQVTGIDLTNGTFTHDLSAVVPGNCSKGLGVPTVCAAVGSTYQFSPGSLIGRFIAVGWYIGNNGRPATGGRSLYRVTRQGAEEVAEGVRDMQLGYLAAGAADYVAAAAVADWNLVTAVRFDITFESPETGVSTTGAAQRLVRTVAFTANLRNLQP